MTQPSDSGGRPLETSPFPGGPTVNIETLVEGTRVTVWVGTGQVLPAEDRQRVAAALGLVLAEEPEQSGTAVKTEAEPTHDLVAEFLGRVSVDSVARVKPVEAPQVRRHRLLSMIGRTLLAPDVDASEFIEGLPSSAQRALISLVMDNHTAFSGTTPEIALQTLQSSLHIRNPTNIRRNADAVITAAHTRFPDVITAELIERPSRPTTHAAAAVYALMREAGITQEDAGRSMGATLFAANKILAGRSYPTANRFQQLVYYVNQELARQQKLGILKPGLRPLTAAEAEQLIDQYVTQRTVLYGRAREQA